MGLFKIFRNAHKRRKRVVKGATLKRADQARLPSGYTLTRKQKTLQNNALGRLEASVLSRSVPDDRFNDRKFENSNLKDKHEYIKNWLKVDRLKPEKMVFDKDSEICRARKKRRDDIMKRTGGKGLRVKNALWNFTSFIQCK